MENKKAEDIKIINLKNIKNSVTDYFVLATGNSNIHIDSIAVGIEEDVFENFREKPWNKEGKDNAEWVLIDFGDVLVHVMHPETREFYSLEKLWDESLNNEQMI